MSDLFLTWASDCTEENISEYLVYFKSLKNKARDADVVCLTHSLAPEHAFKISALGCRVKQVASCEWVLRDRWFHFWDYLSSHSDHYDCVLICDSRDVLVQGDPFIFLRRSWPKKILVTSEGFNHIDSQWNMAEQLEAQKSLPVELRNYVFWPVVNGGVVLGRIQPVRNFCFLVWSAVMRNTAACTDQAVINYLMSFLKNDPDYRICDPHDSLLCITGEGVKNSLLKFVPIFKDGKICNSDAQPYILFHQWDRTIFKQEILNQFSA